MIMQAFLIVQIGGHMYINESKLKRNAAVGWNKKSLSARAEKWIIIFLLPFEQFGKQVVVINKVQLYVQERGQQKKKVNLPRYLLKGFSRAWKCTAQIFRQKAT